MSPVEIIFVLLGIGILIVSCFVDVKDEKEEVSAAVTIPEEVLETQKQEIKKFTEQVMEEKSEDIVVKTDDYLSKISNEKIMAVNDYSTQILEKIDANHKEVVFLYDMLNQKEDEIKHTVQQFNQEKQEMQEVVNDIVKLTQQVKASMKKVETAKTTAEKIKKSEVKKPVAVKQPEPVNAIENQADGQLEFTEMMQADHQKEEVLRLYKQGKSILDISKTMGMGQGEVKLIIGLYGI